MATDKKTRRVNHHLKLYKSLSLAGTQHGQSVNGASANLVLAYLRSFCLSDGVVTCWPTLEQIASAIGVSTKTVSRALKVLVAAERITIEVKEDEFPTEIDGRMVKKKHNVYIMIRHPEDLERFGLFPLTLFEDNRFKDEKLPVSAKSVLLSLYLMAQGQKSLEFLIGDLTQEAMLKKREFALKALSELSERNLITFTNPCNRHKPYESTKLSAALLV